MSAIAGVILLVAVGAAQPCAVVYDHAGAGYVHQLEAAALETDARVPNRVASGYSAVDLDKAPGEEYGQCEAAGAGTHVDLRDGLLENGGPPDAYTKVPHTYNPTEANERRPDLRPGGSMVPRRGGLPLVREAQDVLSRPPPEVRGPWSADCADDTVGRAAGHHVDEVGGGAAGSATTGAVDEATGAYVGTSRAFATGLRSPAGVVDLVSSAVRVEQRPGHSPSVSYRIAVNGGVLATGTDVRAPDLNRQFAEEIRRRSTAVAGLHALGLTPAGPTYDEYPTRHVVHFPFLEAAPGGDDAGRVRVVTTTYRSADLHTRIRPAR